MAFAMGFFDNEAALIIPTRREFRRRKSFDYEHNERILSDDKIKLLAAGMQREQRQRT